MSWQGSPANSATDRWRRWIGSCRSMTSPWVSASRVTPSAMSVRTARSVTTEWEGADGERTLQAVVHESPGRDQCGGSRLHGSSSAAVDVLRDPGRECHPRRAEFLHRYLP